MKNSTLIIIQHIKFVWQIVTMLAIIVVISSCTKDKVPTLQVKHTIEGLQVTLVGNATQDNGSIVGLTIDWGDGKNTTKKNESFENFNETHLYLEPSTYIILVVVTSSTGKEVSNSISISADFKEILLDNIKNSMFKTKAGEYLILSVNLHTYQEERQNEKFNILAELIGKMDVDFIAFQECAQNKSSAISNGLIRVDNMALIIATKLKEKYKNNYSFAWDWTHYGWDVWEEGIAVLSKFPLSGQESRFISSNQSTTSITSRKAIFSSFKIPEGQVNFFSVHTHWRTSETDVEQNNQIINTKKMVAEKDLAYPAVATLVCGDFNGNPTSSAPWSEGYQTMLSSGDYEDTFLTAYPEANTIPANSIYNTIGGTFPGRIDYIFMKRNTNVKVIDSQIIFNDNLIPKISDHFGVLTKISFN